MAVRIIWVDKAKQTYVKDGINDFIKRIRRFGKFEIVEIESKRYSKNADIERTKLEESVKIIKSFKNSSFKIALDSEGEVMDSKSFSAILKKHFIQTGREIEFIVGGTYGLAPLVLNRVDKKLSLSAMIMNHELVRLFLLEQIYRGFCIIHKMPYQKD